MILLDLNSAWKNCNANGRRRGTAVYRPIYIEKFWKKWTQNEVWPNSQGIMLNWLHKKYPKLGDFYLEPKWHLFLKGPNPPKEGPNSNQNSRGPIWVIRYRRFPRLSQENDILSWFPGGGKPPFLFETASSGTSSSISEGESESSKSHRSPPGGGQLAGLKRLISWQVLQKRVQKV